MTSLLDSEAVREDVARAFIRSGNVADVEPVLRYAAGRLAARRRPGTPAGVRAVVEWVEAVIEQGLADTAEAVAAGLLVHDPHAALRAEQRAVSVAEARARLEAAEPAPPAERREWEDALDDVLAGDDLDDLDDEDFRAILSEVDDAA